MAWHPAYPPATKEKCLQMALRSYNVVSSGAGWVFNEDLMLLIRLGVDAGLLSGDHDLGEFLLLYSALVINSCWSGI